MEVIKALGTSTKNTVVVEFFPGLVSTWPLLLYGLKWYRDTGKSVLGLGEISLTNWNIIVSLLVLIGLYGIGHIISKLGARLEVWLECIVLCVHRNKLKNDLPFENNNKETCFKSKPEYIKIKHFYSIWYAYLHIAFNTDYTPAIVRYYSNFVAAFKFELNMVCAIALMSLSLSFIENDGWFYKCFRGSQSLSIDLFNPETYVTFTVLSLMLFTYMLFECFSAIPQQHKLRKEIIRSRNELK